MADVRPESLKRITTKAQADDFIADQINAIKKAYNHGLRDEYKTNNFVYSVDSKGNDLVFKGFKDDVHQSVAAPYVVCPVHTKEAWEEFVHSHPTGPDTPGTENGGEGIDPAP